MIINLQKITLALLLVLLLTNISLAENNTEYNNETNNTILNNLSLTNKNKTNFFYSQSSYICYPYNLTNNNNLGECLTFTIYGLENPDENLDDNYYIYDGELDIYWLNQGISFHLIFYNESYDLGIANISYGEYIDFKNKIIDYFYTNGTILNETYYYLNNKLIARNDSKNLFFYHPDNLGSTTLVTNQSGSIVEEEFYLPYGDIYSGEEDSRFLYTGKEKEKDTGLYYYGARYYYPFQRQFIQPDSYIFDIYNPQDLNRYSYVRNNPYKYTDPTGQYISPLDILDYVSLVASIIAFAGDPSLENLGYVGVDVVSAAVPVLGGVGAFAKGAKVASKADEVDDVADVAKNLNKAGDAAKEADKIKEIKFSELPESVQDTINKIESGKTEGLRLHEFKNKYGDIPKKDSGYYTAYDTTKGRLNDQRIITGKGGEKYYTDKHYEKGSFNKVIDKIKEILGDQKSKKK